MISIINLNGNSVGVVTIPASPGFESAEFTYTPAVASVTSIFTGQVQTQQWAGADLWRGTATLPPMTQSQLDPWKAALMQMQGMVNALQLGVPLKSSPSGTVRGTPVVDGSIAVVAGAITLPTMGWTPSQTNLLLPGDYIQVGYRLYTVLDEVISDSNGKSVLNIGPSLREIPTAGESVVTQNPLGLFRLAKNSVTWSTDYTGLSRLSFQFQEFR
jgi:hypothetical protein